MLARIVTGAVLGVDAYLVRVEVDVASGLPSFSAVGLAHGAVREGRERVAAALQNAGFQLPPKRITVNLAAARLRKEPPARPGGRLCFNEPSRSPVRFRSSLDQYP